MKRDIGHNPDENTGGGGGSDSSAKDKEGAIQERADEDTAELRAAVRRQFQSERGGETFQHGS